MFPQIFGKYVLEREIAAGGMARVYLATLRGAVGFEKRLVVKQIRAELAFDDAFVRRFVEEAKTAVELGHPNIVPVYELGVEEGVYYIAMELCEGVSLAELLHATGPLSPEEGAYVAIEICRALDYAHRRAGIVHRDVTPRNVMIDDEGAVRLIDFGIAAPVTGDDGERAEVFGSPGHMPPEQIDGRALTPATDVFAVGALLIEAWTGRPPFRRRTPAECRTAMETPPARVSDSVPELEPIADLLAAAVKLDPGERPSSPEELARPLRRFVRSTDLGDVARRLGERVERTRRQHESSEAWLPGEGVSTALPPPAAETAPRIETRTFAAREDLVAWTQGFGDGQPATRKLPSEPPPAEPDPPREAERRQSEPEVGSITTSGGRREGGGSWKLALAAGVGVVVAAVLGARWLAAPPPPPPLAATTPSAVAPAPSTAPAPTPPPASPSVAPPPSSAPAPPATRAPLPSARTPAPGACRVTLTSTPPGATVLVGGRAFTTPARSVEVPCGAQHATFRHAALNDFASASFTLAPGVARAVHADWSTGTRDVIIR